MKINHHKRAGKGWKVLAEIASQNKLINYGELGKRIGIHHRAVRLVLGLIQDHCLNHELPPLTILVINKKEGKPGDGFIAWDVENIESGLEQVYNFNWNNYQNPFEFAITGTTEKELIEKLIQAPDKSEEIYGIVKSRGTAQSIFRKALLEAYESKCAFCGLEFEFILEASHIIPWSVANKQQRLDIRNGMLLCSNHHKLFDSFWMTVNSEYKIEYTDMLEDEGEYQSVDRRLTIDLNGKKIFLPKDKNLHPKLEYLNYRKE
jgi:putative restriction endonuclease